MALREIKFRGKRIEDGEWIFGDLIHCLDGTILITPDDMDFVTDYTIAPETVGQFTGLKDKDGKEIWEGDRVKCSYFKMSVGANLGVTEVDAELIGTISFNDLSLVVENIMGEKWSHYTGYEDGEGSCQIAYLHDVYEGSTDAEMSIEVIGNIHDNPELIS